MDTATLQRLDPATTSSALVFLQRLAAYRDRLTGIANRIDNAQATLTALQAGDTNAKSDLTAIADILNFFQSTPTDLSDLAQLDLPSAASAVQNVEDGLNDLQSLSTADIAGLKPFITAINTLQSRQTEINYVNSFLQSTFQQWLTQDTSFNVAGQSLTVRFVTTSTASVFSPAAALSIEVAYPGGFRLQVTGVYLEVTAGASLPQPVIDWSKADLKPGFDLLIVAQRSLTHWPGSMGYGGLGFCHG